MGSVGAAGAVSETRRVSPGRAICGGGLMAGTRRRSALRDRDVTKKRGGRMPPARAGAKKARAVRQEKALELRIAGGSFRRIGTTLGCSAMEAWRAVSSALDAVMARSTESAERLRMMELLRCDTMTVSLWPAVLRGDAEAVRACLRVSQRRCALLGLDMATAQKIELTGRAGGPIAMSHETEDLSRLTTEQLEAKLGELAEYLRSLRAPSNSPPEPPEPVDPKAAYAAVLAERAAGGNGHGAH